MDNSESASLPTVDAAIEVWLHSQFCHHHVDRQIQGTYGRVYVLVARGERISPKSFAAKTIDLNRACELQSEMDLEALFKQELQLWMNLPDHRNVLPVMQIYCMPVPEHLRQTISYRSLPFATMPYCHATLRQWIDSRAETPGEAALLIAIACLCNGLCWLYEQGIEGHGDLKPENVLIDDLRGRFALLHGANVYPSVERPWQIRVADFGWTDIWRRLGGSETEKAWRPYLAPERMEGKFIPELSDVFAVATIAVELLTGNHPAGAKTSVVGRWKKSRYGSWTKAGNRCLSGIQSGRIHDILCRCLAPIPEDRPRTAELRDVVTDVLDRDHGLRIGDLLAHFNAEADQRKCVPGRPSWADSQLAQLDADSVDESILRALTRWESFGTPTNLSDVDAARWLVETRTLVLLLRQRAHAEDNERAAEFAVLFGRVALVDYWGRDLRRDVLGSTSDAIYRLDELPDFYLAYAHWALQQLEALVGTTDARYLELRNLGDEKYREHQQTWPIDEMFGFGQEGQN